MSTIVFTVISAFYFVLPAYFANMCPVIFGKLGLLKSLAKPIDGNRKFRGQELFGQNKTWRGLVAGIIGGIIIAGCQSWLMAYPSFQSIAVYDYSSWFLFGSLAGAGAILGDLVESFFKRRLGIRSGGVWIGFDQLDFIVGFFLFTYLIVWPGWPIFLAICLMTLLLHPLSNIFAYAIGFKNVAH